LSTRKDWVQVTRFDFDDPKEIVGKYTKDLDKDKIDWFVRTDKNGKWALFREPLPELSPPTKKKKVKKIPYTRGVQLHNLFGDKFLRACKEVINHQLKKESKNA
jgi:hypothetical protein